MYTGNLLNYGRSGHMLGVKQFVQKYVNTQDSLLAFLVGLLLLLAFSTWFINCVSTHYVGNNYIPTIWLYFIPAMLVLLIFSLFALDKSPRLAFFTRSYCFYFFILLAFGFVINGVQYTPFAPIDSGLKALDQALGFNTVALIEWTAKQPKLQLLFKLMYDFLDAELFVIPILLGCFKDHRPFNRLLMSMALAFFVGCLIYYLFPTAAPSSVFTSPYFLPEEHATALKFYEIHHYQPVTTSLGGLIAFPSFHVTWAVLLTAVFYKKKYLFIPLLVLNALAILSTMFLGWHYLIDVIAGFALAGFCLLLVRLMAKRWDLPA